MEIGLIVLAIMLATLLGWLLKQSVNTTPWISEQVSDTAHHGPMGDSSNTKLIALMTAPSPIVTPGKMVQLAPIVTRAPMCTWPTRHSASGGAPT